MCVCLCLTESLCWSLETLLCCTYLLSGVQLFVTSQTVAHQAPLSMGVLQARVLECVTLSFSRGSSQPRDHTQVSHITG